VILFRSKGNLNKPDRRRRIASRPARRGIKQLSTMPRAGNAIGPQKPSKRPFTNDVRAEGLDLAEQLSFG